MKYRSLCVGKVRKRQGPPTVCTCRKQDETVVRKVLAIRTNFKRTLSFIGPEVKDGCPVLALADGYNEGGLGIKERSAEKRFRARVLRWAGEETYRQMKIWGKQNQAAQVQAVTLEYCRAAQEDCPVIAFSASK
ncbi:hypothetical protein DKX38_018540 [Salix brachista]|uniref:Uncharacterized protein n=1 Tax=Salix brachista TaxID=2182728 RepID=A0A5N5KND2_9ROSI|nr:hypothetical protein DKX38_018540 [Salix brachista]